MTATLMSRGDSIRIKGLSKPDHLKFRRAVILDGAPSISAWLSRAVRRVIREQELKHGDLLNALTPDELDIIEVVQSGANDPEYIAAETMIAPARLAAMLVDLVSRDVLEIRRQGGKTAQARGARRLLYFVTEKYQSKLE